MPTFTTPFCDCTECRRLITLPLGLYWPAQGEGWARCSLVFGSEAALVVSTVSLRWRPAAELLTDGQSRLSAGWSVLRLPWPQIHPRAALVRHGGALVAR